MTHPEADTVTEVREFAALDLKQISVDFTHSKHAFQA
jgi:hypothetical protein